VENKQGSEGEAHCPPKSTR